MGEPQWNYDKLLWEYEQLLTKNKALQAQLDQHRWIPVENMQGEFQIKFVDSGTMGDILGVKSKHVRIWARQDKIPKLVLPSGRFTFNPNAVIEALKANKGDTDEQ